MSLRLIAFLAAACAFAQPPTMKQLMLDLIHPAANDIVLLVNRGGPQNDSDWAAARRSAITLEQSATLLMQPGRARNTEDWARDTKLLGEAGSAAYRAALNKNAKALAAAAESIDNSCTVCHKQFRPDVFPRSESRGAE
ncbi:MAG: hypothetical protein JOZ22_02600 [Acidobacteriia bacterium]|nr:hypothetical protein [Terriglobia bacterium]MBV9744543.1 hypothetical protein [Terriglobia bacterium]